MEDNTIVDIVEGMAITRSEAERTKAIHCSATCPKCKSKNIDIVRVVKPIKKRPCGGVWHVYSCLDCNHGWEN